MFGAVLVFSGIHFLRHTDEVSDVTQQWAVRLLLRWLPVTGECVGGAFFVRENGMRKATPLFLALVVIEATDLVFAIDSIPAVYAVTTDPFIALSSKILAILGLRALYFVIADWVT